MEGKNKDDECREIIEAMMIEKISLTQGEKKLNEIIQNKEVTPKTFDEYGRTLLHNVAIEAKFIGSWDSFIKDWLERFIRRLIKDEGYDPNTRTKDERKTLLFFLVSGSDVERGWYIFMKELIEEHGADPLLTIPVYESGEKNLRQYIDYQWSYRVAEMDTSDTRRDVKVKPFLDYLIAYELRETGQIKPTRWSVQPSLKL